MNAIPLVDIRNSSPVQLVQTHAEQARALIRASRDTLGVVSRIVSYFLLPPGDKISKEWLEKTNNPYRHEIESYAAILGVQGVYALNLCYEWGCTSGAYRKDRDVVLFRVLDWAFPALGENMIVAHQSGQAGDFYNVTWPGVSGLFNAMAPGRFVAALNQAPMRRHNLPFVFDWAKNRKLMFAGTGLPPAHLLRKVFETATTYQEAKHLLATEEIALPVIFTLTGTKDGEGCVIERTEKDFALRDMQDDRVCTANHFVSRLKDQGHGWRPRPIDSFGRLNMASAMPVNEFDNNFCWFKGPIANSHTRLAMTANARTGTMSVMGTAGVTPVTQVFQL